MQLRYLHSLLIVLCTQACPAADASDGPRFECRWTHFSVEIDGQRESAWEAATEIGPFRQIGSESVDQPASQPTRSWLLWDRQFVYFFAEMRDGDIVEDEQAEAEALLAQDAIVLLLKPSVNAPGYFEFRVSAASQRWTAFYPQRGEPARDQLDPLIPFQVESEVRLGRRNGPGWSVEGRIPWRNFVLAGGRPAAEEIWTFAHCRHDHAAGSNRIELSSCAPLKSRDLHRHEEYAQLRFVGPRGTSLGAPPRGIEERTGLTTSRVVGSPDPPLPYRVERAFPQLNVNAPIAIRHLPGTNEFLAITANRSFGPTSLHRFANDAQVSETEMLADFPQHTYYDFCFHPDFLRNGYIYFGRNGPLDGEDRSSSIIRYFLDPKPPHRFDPDSGLVILEWASDGHNGAAVVFGNDGMLYVTSGDGTSDSDMNLAGQRLDLLLSKLLRIDVDNPPPGDTYTVPPDNPFVGRLDTRPETWAYGFRNPWRICSDPQSGQIWVGNNGQDLWEQAYLVERGANYGWSVYEGSHPFYLDRQLGPTPVSPPTVEHPHSVSRSLTGGVVYRGDELPDLDGAYIYGDYSTGKIWGVKHDGQSILWHRELADTNLQIAYFSLDDRGQLMIVDHRENDEGAFYRLVPASVQEQDHPFPTKLSETGLFRSVAEHELHSALIPYSVNVPQWTGDAIQERYLALPGAEPHIDFSAAEAWDFPEGTVLIKSLGWDIIRNGKLSRYWVETQLLTKQHGEWVGYTYAWNDDQTDAMLVAAEGTDLSVPVPSSAGVGKQVWRFSSRSQCMGCHSRAGGYVLGTSTSQMNRLHDHGGVAVNQLQLLEDLDLFHVNWKRKATNELRGQLIALGIDKKQAGERADQLTKLSDQRRASAAILLDKSPRDYRRLIPTDDPSATAAERAKSYLHANCAHCHKSSGGGNAQINLSFGVSGKVLQLIDVKPMHATFDIHDARLVAPGDPYRSVLYYRLATVGGGRMPRIGSYGVDHGALGLMRKWIREMPTDETPSTGETDGPAASPDTQCPAELAKIVAVLAADAQGSKIQAAIASLLQSTSGAMRLADVVEKRPIDDAIRRVVVAAGAAHESVTVSGLFERMLPPDQRIERLGDDVDADLILTIKGDASRGRELFVKGAVANCKSCHPLEAGVPRVGPDLAEAGKRLNRRQLLESILFPSHKVDEKYRTHVVETTDGRLLTGIIVQRDNDGIVLASGSEPAVALRNEEVEELQRIETSLMPDGLARDMTAEQLADLLAWLTSIK